MTGADGFIGSHMTELLVASGYKVRALCQYNSFNSWGWLDGITNSTNVEVVSGDIRDRDFCAELMHGVGRVINFAALIAIPYSYKAAQSYLDTNAKGTLNLCQAALNEKISRFIQISTSEVYGTAQYVPIDEKHPLQPQSPYSASKISSDALAMSYYYSFELPVVLARPFNTYGPRQSARAIIPTVISQLLSGIETIKLGDLRPTRDFNYVLDTCSAIAALLECDNAVGEVVNIGSGTEISIGGLVEQLIALMGVKAVVESDQNRIRPQNSEVFRLLCDNTKLRDMTGYKNKYSLGHGLQNTIDWFKKDVNKKQYKAELYNV